MLFHKKWKNPYKQVFQKTQKSRKRAFSILYRPLAGPAPKSDLKTASGIKFCTLEVILHAQEVPLHHEVVHRYWGDWDGQSNLPSLYRVAVNGSYMVARSLFLLLFLNCSASCSAMLGYHFVHLWAAASEGARFIRNIIHCLVSWADLRSTGGQFST